MDKNKLASRRKTSILWNHFEETDSKKGKCNYCSEIISYTAGSLGNFTRHLKRKHPTISVGPVERQRAVTEVSETAPQDQDQERNRPSMNSDLRPFTQKSAAQPLIDGFTVKPLPPSKKAKIDHQLLIMIAKEYHPLNLVNDTEFIKFVAMLNPAYNLPTRKTLTENLLPQHYLQLKQKVLIELSKASAVCITTDAWTSDNNESFIGITAHYINLLS